MPNWCQNRLTVTPDVDARDDMYKLIGFIEGDESEFDFNKVIPYPEKYAKMDAEKDSSGFNAGGYDWCIDNWGTKWNACYAEVTQNENSVEIHFDTAWSPSISITHRLSELFPTLTFEHMFEEGGMDYSGMYIFKAGEVIEEKHGGYGDIMLWDEDYYEIEPEDEVDFNKIGKEDGE